MPGSSFSSSPLTGRVDLHTHSAYSDGVLQPAELVRTAAAAGITALALTDHDTTAGLMEAETEATRLGLMFVPGVELSTGDDGDDVHLLGYFIDRHDADLQRALQRFASERSARLDRIVERLADAGVELDAARVRELGGQGTLGRPHVARAMIEAGYVRSIGEAFERYLRRGQPGFVARPKVRPEAAIAVVVAAGGVPVLAHPLGVANLDATLKQLVPVGLRGIEVYYGEYDDQVRTALRRTADQWNLVATGGSDFHGVGFKAGRDLGGPAVPFESVERLRALSDRAHGNSSH